MMTISYLSTVEDLTLIYNTFPLEYFFDLGRCKTPAVTKEKKVKKKKIKKDNLP